MKTRNYLLGLLFISSCIEKADKNSKVDSRTKSQVQYYADTTATISSLQNDLKFTSRQYGEMIISGMVKPSDNEQTFAWLDSLQSDNPDTRNFAFRVYKAMVIKSDAALSEAICSYIKDYFSIHPKEFLDNYKALNNQEKASTKESLAFEFYAPGTDYKKDIDDYFETIKSRCMGCTKSDMNILDDIRFTLGSRIDEMAE